MQLLHEPVYTEPFEYDQVALRFTVQPIRWRNFHDERISLPISFKIEHSTNKSISQCF